MKAPKHYLDQKLRPPSSLSKTHTAFVKALALGEPPYLAARRLAKDQAHASQLLLRFAQDPSTHEAVRREVETQLHIYALPLAIHVILSTLKAGGKQAIPTAKFVIALVKKRKRASDNLAKRGLKTTPAQDVALSQAVEAARAKLAELDAEAPVKHSQA